MRVGARVGRRTPYEIAFGAEEFAGHEFPAIADEAERRGLAKLSPDEFAGLARVGALLERVVPDESDPAALSRYVDILFHAYHFWNAGCPLYAVEEPVLRSLVETPPDLARWALRAPSSALYFELPKNLFWAAVMEGAPPEPVEGLFTELGSAGTVAGARVLAVLGIRPDRPGFSVVQVAGRLDEARQFADAESFRSEIPGAELAGLYSVRHRSELLMLVLRMLWYVDIYPESSELVKAVARAGPESAGRDQITALDHRRVRLIERSRG